MTSLPEDEAKHGSEPGGHAGDPLTGGDAEGLRDLAYRSRRAARTARRVAEAEKHNLDAEEMLLALAGHAEATADSADALAGWLEQARGPCRRTPGR